MSNQHTILLVEDEANIATFMSTTLKAHDYNVLQAVSGQEGLMMATSHCPDLILLDLGLPDMDGLRLVEAVREWSQMPILVVSARSQEIDKVQALDLGADDYITKPFGTSELLARVRTALRHGQNRSANLGQTGVFTVGDLRIDYDKRRIIIDGAPVHLTQTEYNIVALLSAYAGRVLTYDFLMKEIWGPCLTGSNQILRVNMANIRRKIERNPAEPRYIFTETGVGYRMADASDTGN
jgi:two-component system KDP operon response regulator KdpE